MVRRGDPAARAVRPRSGHRRAALCPGDLRGPQGLSPQATAASPCSAPSRTPAASRPRPSAWRCPCCRKPRFSARSRNWSRPTSHWVPGGDGSLYLRPFMFANETFLGVRPASEYWFVVIASPVGAYFKGGKKAVSVWLSADYTRAAPGGTGAAKCGGNYAASLVAQAEAIKQGCDQVVFLDAAERRWVEELGGMNVFFVFDDGSMLTPPLGGTILPGVTRDSIITLARAEGRRCARSAIQLPVMAGGRRERPACARPSPAAPRRSSPRSAKSRSSDGGFVIGNGGGGEVAEGLAGETRRHPARRHRRRARLGPQGRVGPSSPAGAALRDAHITLRGARTPSPALCWGRWLAEPAGWGVARCCEAGRLARPRERTFDDAFLLSTPHPSGFARHLPRFAEKGARNRLMFGRKRTSALKALVGYADVCIP